MKYFYKGLLLLVWLISANPQMTRGSEDKSTLTVKESKESLKDGVLSWHDEHADEDGHDHHGHESHWSIPIGVMGAHLHKQGELMFSYRYMSMAMEQTYDGDSVIDSSSVLANPPAGIAPGNGNFLVVPTDMRTEMHMWGAMYGLTDNITLSAMLPYIHRTMNHRRFDGVTFKTKSEGIGDIRLASLIKILEQKHHNVHMTLGLSIPTGSITAEDDVPNAPPPLRNTTTQSRRLPFPMQLGSGTVDFMPGITYQGHDGNISWGSQASGIFRLYQNSEGYSLGDEFNATAWGAYRWTDWVSTSFRLNGKVWADYSGSDASIGAPLPGVVRGNAALVVPTADPERRGGARIDASWGVNFNIPRGFFRNNRISAEFSLPVYQNLDGPQLGSDWMVTTGWQWSF